MTSAEHPFGCQLEPWGMVLPMANGCKLKC